MSAHDRQFFDTFMLVLGALVGFTIAIYVLANYMAGRTQSQWVAQEATGQRQIAERIAPVAQVAVAGQEPPVAEAPAPSAPAPAAPAGDTGGAAPVAQPTPVATVAAIDSGAIYSSYCVACHGMGVAGAPKLGDAEAWVPRIAQGLEVLVRHAIEGYQGEKGVMPAKGGFMNLSDEEVTATVEYMVAESQ